MRDVLYNQCQRLYDARAAQMILYGRALGLSHAEAEDVLQETFLAVMRLETVPEKLEHYCLKAFRNRALNCRRGLLRRVLRELESRSWFEPAPADEREDAAVRQLAELPAEQREVIVLKIWQDYTFEEVGALTGVSPNTAAARYRYGLQKLRRSLEQTGYEDDKRIGKRTAKLEALRAISPAARQNLWPAQG
jgi:RNA polymerase sigma-70 factor (ECF subfamily)